MSYTSLGYMLFVACCLIFYYIFPKKHRWWVLLAASIGFYAIVCLKYISFVFVTAASTYAGGRILEAYANKHKAYIKRARRASGRRKSATSTRRRSPGERSGLQRRSCC